jgi:hypothetical protein
VDRKLEKAHQKLTDRVMGQPGVSGTAIGELNGTPCLKVYLSDAGAKKAIPRNQDGFPVVVEVSGPFKAL